MKQQLIFRISLFAFIALCAVIALSAKSTPQPATPTCWQPADKLAQSLYEYQLTHGCYHNEDEVIAAQAADTKRFAAEREAANPPKPVPVYVPIPDLKMPRTIHCDSMTPGSMDCREGW
jgi:hypothetical protein